MCYGGTRLILGIRCLWWISLANQPEENISTMELFDNILKEIYNRVGMWPFHFILILFFWMHICNVQHFDMNFRSMRYIKIDILLFQARRCAISRRCISDSKMKCFSAADPTTRSHSSRSWRKSSERQREWQSSSIQGECKASWDTYPRSGETGACKGTFIYIKPEQDRLFL